MSKDEAPETIWAWDDLHYVEANPHNQFATEYRKVGTPPTLKQARELPEVKTLIETLSRLHRGGGLGLDNHESILTALAPFKEDPT